MIPQFVRFAGFSTLLGLYLSQRSLGVPEYNGLRSYPLNLIRVVPAKGNENLSNSIIHGVNSSKLAQEATILVTQHVRDLMQLGEG
jgi:hypothetical protein